MGRKTTNIIDAEIKEWNATRRENNLREYINKLQTANRVGFINAHLGDILRLVENVIDDTRFQSAVMTIIDLLENFPVNMGQAEIWVQRLKKGMKIAVDMGEIDVYMRLMTNLANLYFSIGYPDFGLYIFRVIYAEATREGKPIYAIKATEGILTSRAKSIPVSDIIEELDEKEAQQIHIAKTEFELNYVKAMASYIRGILYAWSGEADALQKSLYFTTEGVKISQRIRTDSVEILTDIADIYRHRGLANWRLGNHKKAIEDIHHSLEISQYTHDELTVAKCYANLALVNWSAGNLFESEKMHDYASDLYRSMKMAWHLAAQSLDRAIVKLSQGRLSEAEKLIRKQIEDAHAIQNKFERMRGIGNFAIVKLHQGEVKIALKYLIEDMILARELNASAVAICNTYLNLARCYQLLGNHQKAFRCLVNGYKLAKRLQSPPQLMLSYRVAAEILPDKQQRLRMLKRAYKLASQRKLDRAAILLTASSLIEDEEKRQHLWDRGTQLLDRIGADAWYRGHSMDNPPMIMALS